MCTRKPTDVVETIRLMLLTAMQFGYIAAESGESLGSAEDRFIKIFNKKSLKQVFEVKE